MTFENVIEPKMFIFVFEKIPPNLPLPSADFQVCAPKNIKMSQTICSQNLKYVVVAVLIQSSLCPGSRSAVGSVGGELQ